MTVDDTEAETVVDAPAVAATGFSYDEQTLGQSASVFDAGLPLTPPPAPPIGGAVPSDSGPMFERELTASERRHRVKLEARRVRRIVRHFELWSVLRIGIIFFFCLWLILLLTGVLLWSFAESSGVLDDIEGMVESLFALDEEEEFWQGGRIMQVYVVSTGVLCIAGVTFTVLMALLYNLISDLVGGIRVTVIEEETARFTTPRRRIRR